MLVHTARWLFPVTAPPIGDAAVAVSDGRIVHCGPRTEVLAAAGNDSTLREWGDAVLLPGLINAHTHLELSWIGVDPPPTGEMLGWVRGLLERRARETVEELIEAAERQVRSLISRGTVAVGDVGNRLESVPVLARSGLHAVHFHEVYGFPGGDAAQVFARATADVERLRADPDVAAAADRCRVVPAPHAPHTTSAALLRALGTRAKETGEPLSIHLAESEAESALLLDGTGPFVDLLRERGVWDDGFSPPGVSPVEYVDRLGLLTPATLAVHAVQLDRQDHSRIQSRGASVVTCPRSNETLGVGRAPVARLMAEGVPVALGTDSIASAPDLDLFGEMAALRRIHPEITPAACVRMATMNGAQALGFGSILGSVEPGKLARLIAVDLSSAEDDPFEVLCTIPSSVRPLDRHPADADAAS